MGLFSAKTNVVTAPAPETTTKVVEAPNPAPAAAPRPAPVPIVTPPPTQLPPPAAQSERSVYLQQLRVRLHQQLVQRLDMQNLRVLPPETVRGEVRVLIRELCQSE